MKYGFFFFFCCVSRKEANLFIIFVYFQDFLEELNKQKYFKSVSSNLVTSPTLDKRREEEEAKLGFALNMNVKRHKLNRANSSKY